MKKAIFLLAMLSLGVAPVLAFPTTTQPYCQNITLTNAAASHVYRAYLNYNANNALTNMTDGHFYSCNTTASSCDLLDSAQVISFASVNSTWDVRLDDTDNIAYCYGNATGATFGNLSTLWDPRQASLRSYYTYDYNANDSYDENGLINGSVTGADVVNGRLGKAYQFVRDSKDYINFGDYNGFDDTDTFTIMFWINKTVDVPAGQEYWLFSKTESGAVGEYLTSFLDDETVRTTIKDGAGFCTNAVSTPLTSNVWYRVAFVANSTHTQVFLNGTAGTAQTCNKNMANTVSVNYAGAMKAADTHYANAIQDEVLLFSKALNSTEIGNLYNANEITGVQGTEESYTPPAVPLNPIIDNTVICFTTQPVCINLKDRTLIYKGEGYYA